MNLRLGSRALLVALAAVASLARGLAAQQSIPPQVNAVAYYHAPFLITEQITSAYGMTTQRWDHILPVDFDGTLTGEDNFDHSDGTYPTAAPTVYFAAAENGYTSDQGYYFLTYLWYHANDAGGFCFAMFCDSGHQHDLEGAFFVVKKSPYLPYGQLVVAATQAHGAMIPYFNPSASINVGMPGGDYSPRWGGYINFWTDPRIGSAPQRPVVAIRGRTHGSYMAQNCNPSAPLMDHGYGMWGGSYEQYGAYIACLHSGEDNSFLLYRPGLADGDGDPTIPVNEQHGLYTYALREMVNTPMWTLRNSVNVLFGGNHRDLYGAGGVFDGFHSIGEDNAANPAWAWEGGTGSCPHGNCWYGFSIDNTENFNSPQYWYWNGHPGDLIVRPTWEAHNRFPALPELGLELRYDPYLQSPPNYTYPAIQLSILGPSSVTTGEVNTWTASVASGTGPYTYRWSGVLSGTGDSITGTFIQTGDLILEVWDSHGLYAIAGVTVTAGPACTDNQIIC